MAWVRSILDVYFDLRPFHETQALYKSKGLSTFDYWKYEIDYLTKSTWNIDDEFKSLKGVDYLLNKYAGPKIQLDEDDREILRYSFIIELGMNPDTFVFRDD